LSGGQDGQGGSNDHPARVNGVNDVLDSARIVRGRHEVRRVIQAPCGRIVVGR
jgi:hypothetical protein